MAYQATSQDPICIVGEKEEEEEEEERIIRF
jgi:hypothetical protein